ncbi:ABC transporter ATP-binding protein [Nocardia puris]|uniref:ABC transporter ATP-binding protein n=1 Tax=Nocardia puris TaxID=208602 RepID=UPI001895E0DC|nr:ABC transporter ATP-binding protein [Nocardia puris]MBF6209657.1 ABC transporter ATP-binding protein [Nocardia puris]MBF6366229.1 ABC transporter ATP-binding protein [Nocardia puris]MBF6458432.1 ABC transporter ATP-binding protein [Nocardia puris]
MRRILRLMLLAAGSYRAEFRRALWCAVIAAIAQALAYAALVPLLYELSRPEIDTGAAWLWFGVFAACYAVEAVFHYGELRFEFGRWADMLAATRLELGEKLRTMPQSELERRSAGDLTMLLGATVANATVSASTLALWFLRLVSVPAILGVIVLVIDWRLGLVLALSVPFAALFVRRIQRVSGAGLRETDEADAAAANRIVEYVQGLPVLRATGQVGASSRRLVETLERQNEAMSAMQNRLTWPGLLASSIVQLCLVAMVSVGAALVLDLDISAALLVAVVVAAVRFAEPLSNVASMSSLFEVTDSALERIGDVLSTDPLPVGDPEARITRHDLAFDDVHFAYADGPPVLRGVSFALPARSLTALVGPSGSGKTTITRLLTRYADPERGTVRIGGLDLRDLDPVEIYRHISVVFQDVYLFDDTIRANIAMARPDAGQEEIESAARAANAHDFIARLPHGYDTRAGEIGNALSGGERQRISIARAILKDAPIVLLDEPTAALDAENEVYVQQAIDALVAEKTVVVVAHRLSTVVAADRILVLEDGEIVEQGTHEELIAADGRYQSMWSAQTRARHWRVPTSA